MAYVTLVDAKKDIKGPIHGQTSATQPTSSVHNMWELLLVRKSDQTFGSVPEKHNL